MQAPPASRLLTALFLSPGPEVQDPGLQDRSAMARREGGPLARGGPRAARMGGGWRTPQVQPLARGCGQARAPGLPAVEREARRLRRGRRPQLSRALEQWQGGGRGRLGGGRQALRKGETKEPFADCHLHVTRSPPLLSFFPLFLQLWASEGALCTQMLAFSSPLLPAPPARRALGVPRPVPAPRGPGPGDRGGCRAAGDQSQGPAGFVRAPRPLPASRSGPVQPQ